MRKIFASALWVSLLLAAVPVSARNVTTLLPAEPTELHWANYCESTDLYFAGLIFEGASENAAMASAARQAASTYASPDALMSFDDGGLLLRAIDTKDVSSLLRFAKSLHGVEDLQYEVTVLSIRKDLRFASIDEQMDGMRDDFIHDFAETSDANCPGL